MPQAHNPTCSHNSHVYREREGSMLSSKLLAPYSIVTVPQLLLDLTTLQYCADCWNAGCTVVIGGMLNVLSWIPAFPSVCHISPLVKSFFLQNLPAVLLCFSWWAKDGSCFLCRIFVIFWLVEGCLDDWQQGILYYIYKLEGGFYPQCHRALTSECDLKVTVGMK